MMRRLAVGLLGLALLLVAGAGLGQPKKDDPAHVVPYGPRSPAEQKKEFRLPPGFEIELVAAEPDIHKPMNIAFDARGRLWVTDTVEYPFPVAEGQKGRDSIKVLEDFGPDGRARKITTFAGGLNIPIGLLPLDRDALVFSIPNIARLRDADGDGKAEGRDTLYAKYGSKDTHGMTNAFTWSFDGWVYACHGFNNESSVEAADGSKVTMQSGNTYRFKPDGSRIEQYTWGQVNPFGLTVDPLGNLYSADCHSKPLYQLLRGGYYPSFGKPHDGLGFAPEMVKHDHGSTGIAGVAYYAADHFPPPYHNTLFIGNVITNRINHDQLAIKGSTRLGVQQPDFLHCQDRWFRPVDIKLGPDGALYIADFYNRIIGHYEVDLKHPLRDRERGRIWRVVYRGEDGKGKPTMPRADWTRATPRELVADLAHPNLTVRLIATHQLVARGAKEAEEPVREALRPRSDMWQRVHGLWVLQRLGVLDEETLQGLAADILTPVRVHAMRVLGERERLTPALTALALAGLKDHDADVQRAAAEALGRHPRPEHIRPLLDLRHQVPPADSHLRHVVRMALRNQLIADDAWKQPLTRLTSQDEAALADVALGVRSEESARFLLSYLGKQKNPGPALAPMVHHAARHGDEQIAERVVTFARTFSPDDLRQQADLFRALEKGMQESGRPLSKEARGWAAELTGRLLSSTSPERVQDGLKMTASLKLEEMQPTVTSVALSERATEGQRQAAIDALAALNPATHAATIGKVLSDAQAPGRVREHAANVLGRLNNPQAVEELVKALATVPAATQRVIAVALAETPAGSEKLLEAVAGGKASARLLKDLAVGLRLEARKVPNLKERLAALTKGVPEDDFVQRIEERKKGYLLVKPELESGKKAFQTHCAACHQVADQGARLGPQLDGIGLRGLDRLLEDTLDPNRNVDQAFRTTVLNLKNGQVVSGLLVKTEGEVLVMADNQGKEVRVAKKDVDEQFTTPQSPMPANLMDRVPERDYYDLLGYLLSLRPQQK